MSAASVLFTALLLGLFVFLAGCYGVLYAVGQLRGERPLVLAAFASYGLQCMVGIALVLFAPLGGWNAVIAVSCALYLPLPPLTLRYLSDLHHGG